MTPESLERIRKLDRERRQLPLKAHHFQRKEGGEYTSVAHVTYNDSCNDDPRDEYDFYDTATDADCDWIAECSTAVPALIQEVSRLRQALGNIKGLKSGPVSGGKAKLQFDRAVWIARDALAPPPPKKVVDAQERIAQSLRASREALGEEGKS